MPTKSLKNSCESLKYSNTFSGISFSVLILTFSIGSPAWSPYWWISSVGTNCIPSDLKKSCPLVTTTPSIKLIFFLFSPYCTLLDLRVE